MQTVKPVVYILTLLTALSCGYPDRYESPSPPEGERCRGIEIFPLFAEVTVGGNVKAEVLRIHSSGVKSPVEGSLVSWMSEDQKTAGVDAEGIITGIGEGTARITASLEGFSAVCEIRVIRPADYSVLMISEVFYDAAGSDTGREFIEIYNNSGLPCDISGFRLIDGSPSSSAFVFPPGALIAAGGFVVVAQSDAEFFGLFGFSPDYAGIAFALNNSGETVFLEHPDGAVRDAVYIEGGSTDFPAPEAWGSDSTPSSREGFSVGRTGIEDSDSSSDWMECAPNPGS